MTHQELLNEDWLERCRNNKTSGGLLEPRLVNTVVQNKLYLAFLNDLLLQTSNDEDPAGYISNQISERAISSFRKHKIKSLIMCSEGIDLGAIPPNIKVTRPLNLLAGTNLKSGSAGGERRKSATLDDLISLSQEVHCQPICVVGISPASLMGAVLVTCHMGVTGASLSVSFESLCCLLGREFLANKQYQRLILRCLKNNTGTTAPKPRVLPSPEDIYLKQRPKTPELEPWSDYEYDESNETQAPGIRGASGSRAVTRAPLAPLIE